MFVVAVAKRRIWCRRWWPWAQNAIVRLRPPCPAQCRVTCGGAREVLALVPSSRIRLGNRCWQACRRLWSLDSSSSAGRSWRTAWAASLQGSSIGPLAERSWPPLYGSSCVSGSSPLILSNIARLMTVLSAPLSHRYSTNVVEDGFATNGERASTLCFLRRCCLRAVWHWWRAILCVHLCVVLLLLRRCLLLHCLRVERVSRRLLWCERRSRLLLLLVLLLEWRLVIAPRFACSLAAGSTVVRRK